MCRVLGKRVGETGIGIGASALVLDGSYSYRSHWVKLLEQIRGKIRGMYIKEVMTVGAGHELESYKR